MEKIVDLIYSPVTEWEEKAREAFASVLSERYQRVSREDFSPATPGRREKFQLRINVSSSEKNVPFVALIPPTQDRSGPYGGMSFVLFPSDDPDQPALISMVVGTHGISPDEMILGRPGHARKMRAIASWIRKEGAPFAWAKQDPVRTDLILPKSVSEMLGTWHRAVDRYGQVIYGLIIPPSPVPVDDLVSSALSAYLDLFFAERGISVMAKYKDEAESIRRAWLATLLPDLSDEIVADHLRDRKYVVIEGPPGTGKTEMALRLLENDYHGNGRFIQFHPGTTYESFVGGLFPEAGGELGFQFTPRPGHLMAAAEEAAKSGDPYLLVIDEVNRADLSKVLGEAITLFEPTSQSREVTLAFDFPGVGRQLALPKNLHVIGTMNSADRSIAILDLAVRRRFAFVSLWPQLSVVEANSGGELQTAFARLLEIFVEHAPDDAFVLLPGHAYFLGDDAQAPRRLQTEVIPLLREYLAQGYVASFADEVQAWLNVVAAEA